MFKPDIESLSEQRVWNDLITDEHWKLALGYVNPNASFIIDLGCYTGLTTGLYADYFPKAKILGIEMNPKSAEKARENIKQFKNRCTIINATIGFPERESIAYFKEIYPAQDSLGFDEPDRKQIKVKVLPLDYFLDEEIIDFIKIDIEGAERELFKSGKWLDRTKVIHVETHGIGYDEKDAQKELSKYNFNFELSGNHVIAYR